MKPLDWYLGRDSSQDSSPSHQPPTIKTTVIQHNPTVPFRWDPMAALWLRFINCKMMCICMSVCMYIYIYIHMYIDIWYDIQCRCQLEVTWPSWRHLLLPGFEKVAGAGLTAWGGLQRRGELWITWAPKTVTFLTQGNCKKCEISHDSAASI